MQLFHHKNVKKFGFYFGIFAQPFIDKTVLDVAAVHLRAVRYRRPGIVAAVHVKRLVEEHNFLRAAEPLEPESVVLKRRSGRFVMRDLVLFKKHPPINSAPCIHHKTKAL